jgi:hypothetical protein
VDAVPVVVPVPVGADGEYVDPVVVAVVVVLPVDEYE